MFQTSAPGWAIVTDRTEVLQKTYNVSIDIMRFRKSLTAFLMITFLSGLLYGKLNPRLSLRIISVSDTHVELESSGRCSPGTIAQFQTEKGPILLKVFQKLSNTRYIAIRNRDTLSATLKDLYPGMSSETDAVLSYRIERNDVEYWNDLKNCFLN